MEMGKVGIIGVGQSVFSRKYLGSLRELVFEAYKEAMEETGIANSDIDATVICSAPEYDKQRSPAGVIAEYLGLNPQPTLYVESLCSSSSSGCAVFCHMGPGMHRIVGRHHRSEGRFPLNVGPPAHSLLGLGGADLRHDEFSPAPVSTYPKPRAGIKI